MDFKQLETFVTIAKLKSFSKAAEQLYLTQPTISNHIQNLEKELKTVLINRSNKNITLTTAGKILYKYAMEILNKRENALFSLNEFMGKIEGILEISASTIPEQYFLPSLLFEFNRNYPGVQYILKKYDTSQILDKIIGGEIDFGIVGAKKSHNQLIYIEIMDDNIVLAVPNNEYFKDIDSINISDLYNLNLIIREEGSGTRKILEDSLLNHNISLEDLNVFACIENTETIKEFLRNNIGATFISERAIKSEIDMKNIKVININELIINRKFYFVFHKSRSLSPLAQTFKSFVLDALDISS